LTIRPDITYNPVISRVNKYGATNLSYPRLAISTGELDWYRPYTPLAEFLPESLVPNPRINSNGTVSEPQIIIRGEFHESDFYTSANNGTILPPTAVKKAQSRELQAVQSWLKEWNKTHGL
jgi:hypothetical protein